MKNSFTQCTLKDIASNEKKSIISGPFGSNISSKFFQESGVPVIRGNNLSNSCVKFIDNGFAYLSKEKADELNAYAIKDDLLFTAAGTIGQVGIIEKNTKFEKYVISNKQLRVRLNIEKINPLYAYYWFSSPWMVKDIVNKNTGSTVPLINLGIIKTLEINIPKERITQDKIVSVLSALDSKIELNNRINTELEAMAKTLYDYWFVQFDFPDKDGKPYKTSGGKMVWNEELKRDIPDGWTLGTLLDLGEIVGGSTPPREIDDYFAAKGTAWITPKDLSLNTGNKFITKGELDVSEKGIKVASLNIMPKGTILLSSRAPIGYLAISREQVTTNQGFKSFVPKKGYSTEYVYYAVKNMIPTIENNSAGSTFKEVSGSTLKAIKICLPDTGIIKSYTSMVENIFKRQDNLEIENQTLSELRDWLLPMLMNGQVQVTPSH